MAQTHISLKRVGVDKTNSRIVAITAGAGFFIVFFLVSSYLLFGQLTYQNRVIGKKKAAVEQLQDNIEARDSLVTSYEAFVDAPQNLLGGNPSGNGPKDGSNAKLVLDALPSNYDFPALTSSLEKLLLEQRVKITSITGTDEEAVRAEEQLTASPSPIETPFEFSVSGDYAGIQRVITAMELSIRPFQVLTTQVTGDEQNLTLKLTGKTYYQPSKGLHIQKEVVK